MANLRSSHIGPRSSPRISFMKLRRFKDFPLYARVSQETTYALIESSNSNNGYDKENTRKFLYLYFVVIAYACFYRLFSLTWSLSLFLKQSLCIRIEFNSQRKLITIIFNVESPLCNIPNFSASPEVHIEKKIIIIMKSCWHLLVLTNILFTGLCHDYSILEIVFW